MKRVAPNLTVKLAATLLQMKRVDENGKFAPVISYEEAKGLTATEIVRLFQFDHYPIMRTHGGPTEPWNLTPRLKAEHAAKTTGRRGESRLGDQANGDIQRAAKVKRIRRKQVVHATSSYIGGDGKPVIVDESYSIAEPPRRQKPKRKIPSRPFTTRTK